MLGKLVSYQFNHFEYLDLKLYEIEKERVKLIKASKVILIDNYEVMVELIYIDANIDNKETTFHGSRDTVSIGEGFKFTC